MEDNRTTSDTFITSSQSQNFDAPKIVVESCRTEFFYEKFKQSYPMFKNPRGLCLIVNIYQIDGMPPRRWSDRDTESLKQLFEQLLFNVKIYTDSTHDLGIKNFKNIITDFSKLPEHEDAQCCIVCLMSHGEEGFLTTKEGDKILLDDIFALFNNINCPSLAGKPKLFFIQSCRDDPVTGPAEDLGIRLSFNSQNKEQTPDLRDESDGNSKKQLIQRNFETDSMNASNPIYFHIPSMCDMLIGFPTQKGYIAYRKPEIGSWYMNAIVQVFSKHSSDTDLCAMLNMVNSMISNEVTNMGKKQMSEYTSKLTKPYFYFFPGLASETAEEEANSEDILQDCSDLRKSNDDFNDLCYLNASIAKQSELDDYLKIESPNCFNDLLCKKEAENKYLLSDQSDNNRNTTVISSVLLTNKHLEYVSSKACAYWKPIAREIKINESQIMEIEKNTNCSQLNDKLYYVLKLWLNNQTSINGNYYTLDTLLRILTACRLNKVKEKLLLMA